MTTLLDPVDTLAEGITLQPEIPPLNGFPVRDAIAVEDYLYAAGCTGQNWGAAGNGWGRGRFPDAALALLRKMQAAEMTRREIADVFAAAAERHALLCDGATLGGNWIPTKDSIGAALQRDTRAARRSGSGAAA